jgi:hypothetical protein
MAQMTANSEALYQQNPGKRKVEGFVSGSKVTDSDYFREGTTYIGEITVTIPIDGIETKIAEMKGGKGEYLDPNEVDQDQLAVGDEVEMEHTDDPEIADEIALDHLAEIPDYYTKLVAAGLVDELEAIKLHNELFGEV